MNLPSKKKYDNGTLPHYVFIRTFSIGGVYNEPGDNYEVYKYTYDDLIWRIREGIILPTKEQKANVKIT